MKERKTKDAQAPLMKDLADIKQDRLETTLLFKNILDSMDER
jgi:hypothetical protein